MDSVKDLRADCSLYVDRIAHFLKWSRIRRRLTQAQASEIIGISEGTVSNLENKKERGLSLLTLMLLAQFGGMSLPEFIFYLESGDRAEAAASSFAPEQLVPWQKDLIQSYQRLSPATRQAFLHHVLIKPSTNRCERLLSTVIKLAQARATLLPIVEGMVEYGSAKSL